VWVRNEEEDGHRSRRFLQLVLTSQPAPGIALWFRNSNRFAPSQCPATPSSSNSGQQFPFTALSHPTTAVIDSGNVGSENVGSENVGLETKRYR